MGNITSAFQSDKPKSGNTFGQVIDYIATYYILTMDFQSLQKLYDKQYCDNLIVLTSDILQRYFTDMEITYLAQRIKNGVEINEMTKDKVIFFNKSDLEKFNVSNSVKKKRLCLGIAKFYIKIAHVFASIVSTINPVYVYKDAQGSIIKKKLFEKEQIPPNVQRKLYKLGICDNRINALKKGQDVDTDEVKNIHTKMCDMNLGEDGNSKTLNDEPGIPELMDLYLDKYDYANGSFVGMTDQTQSEYTKDLKRFYKVFTGNDVMPETIKKFSDIKLKDYSKLESCIGKTAPLRQNVQLNKTTNKDRLKKKLFDDYAENLKQMIQTTNKNQQELIAIINQLFTYVIDPQTQKKRIIVNPKLSETLLQEIVVKTRKLIINLYLKCENDYATGVKLYQAIVELQIKDTTIKQISTLEKETEKLVQVQPRKPMPVAEPPLETPSLVRPPTSLPAPTAPLQEPTPTPALPEAQIQEPSPALPEAQIQEPAPAPAAPLQALLLPVKEPLAENLAKQPLAQEYQTPESSVLANNLQQTKPYQTLPEQPDIIPNAVPVNQRAF